MNNIILDITQEIGFLNGQLAYIEALIQNATAENDTKEYARLMRLYLPMQKDLLKLYAERSRLELFQKAFIQALFGFIDTETGLRRYREAFFLVGRKNGKSTLLAGLALYMLIADGEGGAEVYSTAT